TWCVVRIKCPNQHSILPDQQISASIRQARFACNGSACALGDFNDRMSNSATVDEVDHHLERFRSETSDEGLDPIGVKQSVNVISLRRCQGRGCCVIEAN